MIIGSISVLAGMNTQGIAKGAKAAGAALTGLASTAQQAGGKFVGIMATFDVGGMLTALPSKILGVAESMDSLGDEADKIGTTTEALSRLSYAAKLTGSDVSALPGALEKMNKNLHDAATKGGPAGAALNAIGLDAKTLTQQDPAEAFKEIADAISGLPNGADRAAAAMAIFGKAGQGLLNTINTDRDAIEELEKESDQLGNTISSTDRIKVGALFDQFDKLGAALTGVGQIIAAELAPYLTAIIEKFIDWMKTGANTGSVVGGAMEGVVKAIGFVADGVQALSIAFTFLQAGATKALGYIVRGIGVLAGAVDSVVTAFGGSQTGATQYLEQLANGISESADSQMAEAWKKLAEPPSSEGITSFFAGIKQSANDAAKSVVDSSKRTAGASKTFTDDIKEQAEKMKELRNKAKSILEATATPIEKANVELKTLDDALAAGVIEQADYDRAVGKLHKDVFGETKHAGALEFGSKEARSALLEYEGKNMDPQKDIARTAKEQLTELRMSNVLIERLIKLQEKEPSVEVMDD